MNIHKIKLTNFKSFREPTTINFDKMGGMWKIEGKVGSGKTTIGEGIIFGLFGSVSGKNMKDLISWGEKHALVEIWFDCKGGYNLYIRREINIYNQSPMTVECNGEVLNFPDKREAQATLETEYYDTTKTIMELLCIISFNNFKSLATLNTQDTKRFLDYALGFDQLTNRVEACKIARSDCQSKKSELESGIRSCRDQIQRLEHIIKESATEDTTELTNLRTVIIETQQKLNNNYNTQHKKLEATVDAHKSSLASSKNLAATLKKEIVCIENGVCSVCGSPVSNSLIDSKRTQYQELLKTISVLSGELQSLKGQLSALQTEYNNKNTRCINKLREIEVKLAQNTERSSYNESISLQITDLHNQIQVKSKELASTETDLECWNELLNYLQFEVRSIILRSFTPVINANIQKYINLLGLPYRITFDETFTCSICLTNDVTVPVSSLSTGQLKVADMIIILGVLGSIMKGGHSNIIFLDELFTNLDSELRNKMCGVLTNILTEDLTIMIISHQSLDEKYFNGCIKITRTGQDTQLEFVNY